jgi:broad specificity phosphatase PhoE
MATTRVFLMRHGETIWNLEGRYQGQLDSSLTPTGLAQSRALAARLARHTITTLYSSDLGRALQTAQIVAKSTGRRVVTDSRLRERHLGIFQGLLKAEIQQKFPDEHRLFKSAGPDHVTPGGESARQAFERIFGCLEELASRHAGEPTAVITHGGVVSALLRHTVGIPLDAPRRFERRNASWNVFSWKEGKWFLETWGDVSHLQETP